MNEPQLSKRPLLTRARIGVLMGGNRLSAMCRSGLALQCIGRWPAAATTR